MVEYTSRSEDSVTSILDKSIQLKDLIMKIHPKEDFNFEKAGTGPKVFA